MLNNEPKFDGDDYNHTRDYSRLKGQILDIFDLMKDGKWRSLAEIEEITGHGQSSVSAQLRNLRKDKFGSYKVERVHVQNGFYKYRLDIHDHQETQKKKNNSVLSSQDVSDDVIDFIKEYFTQDNLGTAYPIYFVIRDIDWQACYDGIDPDRYLCIWDTDEVACADTLDELFEQIKSNCPDMIFPEDWPKDNFWITTYECDEFEKANDPCTIVGQSKYYKEDNMFLLQSDAKKHLEANRHHYSNEAIVYCKHAWRSPRQKQFFNALKEMVGA